MLRIVSLLPSATEILFAVGAGDEVVGVTHECDFPPDALALPKLTAACGPDLTEPAEIDRHVRSAMHAGSSLYFLNSDLLEELAPDLIITQELCPVCAVSYEIVTGAAKRLRSDPRVVSLEPASLEDVLGTIRLLGEITNHAQHAMELVTSLEARINAVSRGDKANTLVLEWTDPPMSAGHWIPELIERAGGTPVLANPGANSQRLEWSAVVEADPDAIVVTPCGFDLERTERAIAELEQVDEWRSLRAVRSGHVCAIDGNAYLSRPGPRLVDATEMIARWYTTLAEHAG
jgi:iron complex transport system substrate-binding protein